MCAIIDANVISEMFGETRTEAGQAFWKAVNKGGLRLVVGGQLLTELDRNEEFRKWRSVANQYGRVHEVQRVQVESKAESLQDSDSCNSNDEHIFALAQVSGARLRCGNDVSLHKDFKNKNLIDDPRGKIYSTIKNTSSTRRIVLRCKNIVILSTYNDAVQYRGSRTVG